MAYGTVKVDNITFTNGGIDQTVTVSGIVQSISGNITATGTIQGATIIGTSTVSGATVTGDAGVFTTVTGGSAGFTTVTGTTVTGTTADFVSGVFTTQISGATITGDIGQYTSLTGVSGVFTTQISGATITGDTFNATSITGISGVFTTQISGATVTGDTGSFATLSGGVATITSGVFALGAEDLPSISFSSDPDTGIYSPGENQVAISTNGTGKLFIDSAGKVTVKGVGTAAFVVEGTAPDNSLFIEGSTGHVGIGTSSPAALLEIAANNGSSSNTLRLNDTDAAVSLNQQIGRIEFYGSDASGAGAGVKAAITAKAASTSQDSYLTFSTSDVSNNDIERLRITNAGSVGIGTTNPASTLDVNGDVTITDKIIHSGDTNTAIRFPANDTVSIETAGSEAARIDSSGRLLVGTSSARTNFFNTTQSANIQLEGTVGTTLMSLVSNADSPGGNASLVFGKTRGTTVGSTTVVQSGDNLGRITFQGSDGTEFVQAADIYAEVDGVPGADDMPGRLVFSTNGGSPDTSPTERMMIQSNGQIGIGRNPSGPDFLQIVEGNAASGQGYCIGTYVTTGGTKSHIRFFHAGSINGTITTNGSATAYNTSSDYRLKENVTPVLDGITRLQQLKPSRFNFIANPDKTVDGFLAHEVQDIVPEAITGERDAVDDEGNPVYQGIDQSKLVPLLTAALQEAIGEIESLKARVAALESA